MLLYSLLRKARTSARSKDENLIPKPAYVAQAVLKSAATITLCQQMYISQDVCKAFVEIARHSTQAYLDMDSSWRYQDGRALKHHDDYVRRHWPDIDKYENHWPLERITRIILKDRHSYVQKQSLNKARQLGLPRHRSASVAYIGRPPLRSTQASASSSSTYRGPDKSEPSSSSSYRAVRDKSAVPRAIAHAPAQSNMASQVAPSCTTKLSDENDINLVKNFLITCKLPVDRVLPQLLQLGIEDAKALLILATQPYRNMWLDRVLELTPIQFKLLTDGLNTFATRERVKEGL